MNGLVYGMYGCYYNRFLYCYSEVFFEKKGLTWKVNTTIDYFSIVKIESSNAFLSILVHTTSIFNLPILMV
jgi:hypothetical protein